MRHHGLDSKVVITRFCKNFAMISVKPTRVRCCQHIVCWPAFEVIEVTVACGVVLSVSGRLCTQMSAEASAALWTCVERHAMGLV